MRHGVTGRRVSGSRACAPSSLDSIATGPMPKRRFGLPDPPWPTATAGSTAISPSVMVVPGWAKVLRYASRVLGQPGTGKLVWEAAAAGAARFAGPPASWPCGVRRGSNPSLMIGLAGIGYFFLGLADPAVPSSS